jgi:hypothetical protein
MAARPHPAMAALHRHVLPFDAEARVLSEDGIMRPRVFGAGERLIDGNEYQSLVARNDL